MARKQPLPPQPIAVAFGLLQDGERALFLTRKNSLGAEEITLPHIRILPGENTVSSLTSAFLLQTGIDGQVHEILFEKRCNSGTRKRTHWIPVLVFQVSAKSPSARPPPEYSGYKWLARDAAVKMKLAKEAQWLY